MKQPEWVLRAVVLALQDLLIAEFGGVAGIRDNTMLDSALARPEHLFTYGFPSIPELAAAYAFVLIKNHPFVDGNKRIGFAVAAIFLEVNGRKLGATEADAVIQTLALAAGEIDEADYARWLDSCCA
jgi:death-on-curing protein